MTQNCYSMRPGIIFGFRGESWKVLSNDTLNKTFVARPTGEGYPDQKTFRYPDSCEISIRWKPTEP